MNAPRTINDLAKEYGDACKRSSEAWDAYHIANLANRRPAVLGGPRQPTPETKPFDGYQIPYGQFEKELGDIIQRDFKLTDKQRGHIMSKAYEQFHSSFGDMFWGAYNLAEWVTQFPKD